MSRPKKACASATPKAAPAADTAPSACAPETAAPTPAAAPPAPFAPPGPTTAAILATLRQIQAEAGRDVARAEMIAALCGCFLYSMEIDGLAATLALLADAAVILERGYGGAGAERAVTVH